MFIDNARWDGVPFLLKAGKALHSKRAEIRVQFRHVPGNLYKGKLGADLDNATNELVRSRRPRCPCSQVVMLVGAPASAASTSLMTDHAHACVRQPRAVHAGPDAQYEEAMHDAPAMYAPCLLPEAECIVVVWLKSALRRAAGDQDPA